MNRFRGLFSGFRAYLRPLGRERLGPPAMFTAVAIVAATEGGLLLAGELVSKWWMVGQLLLLPFVLFSVALGYKVAREADPDPLHTLLACDQATHAPFMLAQAVALAREVAPGAALSSALNALKEELVRRPSEIMYISDTRQVIEGDSAVWAVCGRKSETSAASLYGSCVESFEARGNHIERVFFPPQTAQDAPHLRDAIARHLSTGMTVRCFANRDTAEMVLHDCQLPRGFGMTIMGRCKRADDAATQKPQRKHLHAVLVHWGGMGANGARHGVVLKNREWARHLSTLFNTIAGHTHVAHSNPKCQGKNTLTIDEFMAKYPHYEKPA